MLFLFSRSTTQTKTARAKGVSMLLRHFSYSWVWAWAWWSCHSGEEPPGGAVGTLGWPHSPSAVWAASAQIYHVRRVDEPEGHGCDDILHCITLHTVQRIFMYIISVNTNGNPTCRYHCYSSRTETHRTSRRNRWIHYYHWKLQYLSIKNGQIQQAENQQTHSWTQ